MSNRSGAPFSHLSSAYAFKEAIKSCRGVIDLCRIVSQLPTRQNIGKTDTAIFDEFMEKSDWFELGGSETENGAIAVAKFFAWWATKNPNAGFWICSRWYKDRVVAAFVTAMENGEAESISDTIRELLCTGYAPLFDMLNTPEITSRITWEGTKHLLQLGRPESNTEKKVASIASQLMSLYLSSRRVYDHDDDINALEGKITGLRNELDQVKGERAAEMAGEKLQALQITITHHERKAAAMQFELDELKKQQAAEKRQRTAEKKDHANTKELLERVMKEMTTLKTQLLKRESGQRRGREEDDDDDDAKVKKEVKEENKKLPAAKKPAAKKPAAKKPSPKKPAPKKAKK